jgi:hypothetical protein
MDRALAIVEKSPQRASYEPLMRRRRSELALGTGDAAGAAGDARAALRLELESTPPAMFSSDVAYSHLALGRSLQAQGSLADARAISLRGREPGAPTLGTVHPATRSARQLASETPRHAQDGARGTNPPQP